MNELLVYESEPRNAATLARLGEVKLREVRSLMQLKRAMESQPPCVVAVEVTSDANLATVANLIQTFKRESRRVAVIAMPRSVGVAELQTNRWLYEAGTDLVFESILDREPARRLIRRAVMRSVPTDLNGEVPFRDRVMARLPWKRFTS